MVDWSDVQRVEWLRSFIDCRRWREGKADPSHEYTVREWLPAGTKEFEHVVEVIRQFGVPAQYEWRIYVYLHIDGMKYWTMGEPVSETTVLNRAEA